MLNNLMTTCTKRNEIFQGVSLFIFINTVFPKRLNMVNVKMAIKFYLCFPASLTSVIISFAGITTLLIPIFTIIILISTFPSYVIFTRNYPCFTFPCIRARLRAKIMFTNLRRTLKILLTAIKTGQFNSVILRMINSLKCRFLLVNTKTLFRAKSLSKSVSTALYLFYRITTSFTDSINRCLPCYTLTFIRTIFLVRVVSWWLEHITTTKAWFRKVLSIKFTSASGRAKLNNPVSSFLQLCPTIFTSFHTFNLQQ